MHPVLATCGPFVVYTYGIVMAAACILALLLVRHGNREALGSLSPLRETEIIQWGCWTILGGIVGSRLFHVAVHWVSYRDDPSQMWSLDYGGFSWYGGLGGGLLATRVYLKARREPFLRRVDQVVPIVAIGQAVLRLGCLANGCCVGLPTTSWLGVWFPGHSSAVVPTQWLEAFGLAVLFLLLRWLQTPTRLAQPGALLGWYLVGSSLLRWTVEWWRANQPMLRVGWTLSQAISAGLFLIGCRLLVRTRPRHHEPAPASDRPT